MSIRTRKKVILAKKILKSMKERDERRRREIEKDKEECYLVILGF